MQKLERFGVYYSEPHATTLPFTLHPPTHAYTFTQYSGETQCDPALQCNLSHMLPTANRARNLFRRPSSVHCDPVPAHSGPGTICEVILLSVSHLLHSKPRVTQQDFCKAKMYRTLSRQENRGVILT